MPAPPPPPPPPPDPICVLRGHRAAVQCVAFLPSCQALAAGDAEGELVLWDLDSQRPAASIRAHDSTSGILQVACPASYPWVVSQGRDGVVKCWEVHSGSSFSSQPVQQVASGCYNFCRFALLEPGQTSSSCSMGHLGQAADTQDVGDTGGGGGAALSTTAAAAARGGSSHVVVDGFTAGGGGGDFTPAHESWQPQASDGSTAAPPGLLSQQIKQQVQPQQQHVDGDKALACSQLAGLAVESQGEQQQQQQQAIQHHHPVPVPQEEQEDLTEAAEEQLMVRGSNNTNSSSSSSRSRNRGRAEAAAAAAAGGAPCFLALPAADPAHLGIWQLGAGAGGDGVDAASAAGAAAGGMQLQQQPAMLLQQSKGGGQPHRGQCMAVVLLRPQGLPLHALVGYEDGSVALWDTRNSSTCLAAQKLHTEPVMCLAAAADCRSGFSGSADDRLATFDIDIPKGQLRAGPHVTLSQQGLADVAIRPDGRIAATAGWDAKVRVWHCRKRQPLAILRWHSQQVACVGFSPDSALLAAGGRDNFISLWSLYPPKGAATSVRCL